MLCTFPIIRLQVARDPHLSHERPKIASAGDNLTENEVKKQKTIRVLETKSKTIT